MSAPSEVWLAVIAIAVALMAIVQIAMLVAGVRVARRVGRIANELETGVKPLIAHLTTVSSEASPQRTTGTRSSIATTRVPGHIRRTAAYSTQGSRCTDSRIAATSSPSRPRPRCGAIASRSSASEVCCGRPSRRTACSGKRSGAASQSQARHSSPAAIAISSAAST